MWRILFALLLLTVTVPAAEGQVSIGSLQSAVESSNLEVVTLQGVVHLSRPRRGELGGRCGAAGFLLTDDTGSVEVAVRRAGRLLEPLRDGDRVKVTAQVEVYRNRNNAPLRICIEARDI